MKYLTKEWYNAMQLYARAEGMYQEAKEKQIIPDKLERLFDLHDAELTKHETIGSDIKMTLIGGGTYELLIKNAKVIEDEISDSSDDILFLNYELYNTPTGYNFHMMFWGNNALYYYTLDCSDIDFSYSAPPDTEIIL